jgi:PAS domain S-box-containing protein
MHALARLRGELVRLREEAVEAATPALDMAETALQLTETVRAECAALHQRCTELEQKIEASQAVTRAILDAAPVALITTDNTGRILDTNRAAATLLGRSTPRLREELLLHFFEDRAGFSATLGSLAERAQPVSGTFRMRPRERAPFDANVVVVSDPRGGDTQWLWYASPVSESQTPVGMSGRLSSRSSPLRQHAR